MDREGYKEVCDSYPDVLLPPIENLERGGIVGQCEIIDYVTQSESRWFVGRFGFVIKNGQPLPFRPLPGKLGFFEVTL
jgi:hypothetical protein